MWLNWSTTVNITVTSTRVLCCTATNVTSSATWWTWSPVNHRWYIQAKALAISDNSEALHKQRNKCNLKFTTNTSYETRKRRQSYRHAEPRRQQQHTAIAARVTSNHATVFVTVWPLTFWPLGQLNACRATTIEYMCTKLCWQLNNFPFRVRTNR